MTEKLRLPVIVMISMASGYIGGLMSQSNKPAEAVGKPATVVAQVRAKSFVLVDDAGIVRRKVITDKDGPKVLFYNDAGKLYATYSRH